LLLSGLDTRPKLIEFFLELDVLGVGPLDVEFFLEQSRALALHSSGSGGALSLAVFS